MPLLFSFIRRNAVTGCALMAMCLIGTRALSGQINVQPVTSTKAAAVEEISHAQFAPRVAHLQQVVSACKTAANACTADVGPDNRVQADGHSTAFIAHWDWLRDALEEATKAKQNDRVNAMDAASEHLRELQLESDASAIRSGVDSGKAQKKVADVLARSEFRRAAAAEPSWLDRQMARFYMWFGRLFEGIGRIGEAAPWLGKLLEWSFFVLAAAGLLLFIRRNFARQQLQISMNAGAMQLSAWDREANDWAAEAETCAANHQWRDAVHCLYWAAIVRLEARRAWRHNPARTPREYVRLLQAGSAQQGALRGLTGIFERVWYGLRDAESTDYDRAKKALHAAQ